MNKASYTNIKVISFLGSTGKREREREDGQNVREIKVSENSYSAPECKNEAA